MERLNLLLVKMYLPIPDQLMLSTCRMQWPDTWFLVEFLSGIHINLDFFLFSKIRLVLKS